MISFLNVVVRYPGAARPAVDGVNLVAPAGKVTAVAGPNGSGKSTLIRALLRTVALERGSIALDGAPLDAHDQRAFARRVAVVPQREEPLFPMRVREYVALARFPSLGLWRAGSAGDAEAIQSALESAGMDGYADRRTDELSGGEWQRVRIARALAQGGGALVLDEPATFLDIGHEMAMFELLAARAASGAAVLVVSHHLNLVARFADEIVLLDRGRVAAAGAPADVMTPEVLEPVYHWPLHVGHDAVSNSPALTPLRQTRPTPTTLPTENE